MFLSADSYKILPIFKTYVLVCTKQVQFSLKIIYKKILLEKIIWGYKYHLKMLFLKSKIVFSRFKYQVQLLNECQRTSLKFSWLITQY